MSSRTESRMAAGPVALLAFITVVVHFVTNIVTPYGIHRDEFLYLAMGRHLDLFRMEFPPAIAIIANVSTFLSDSLFAVRFLPALAGGLLVLLSALIAREIGGGRTAQVIGGLAVLSSPLFLRAANLFQPVVFDQLWWTLGLYALVKLCKTEDRVWWVWYGVAVGLGLLTKFSAIFFGAATVLGVVVTSQRKWLLTRWPWVGLAIVLAIGSPSWIGQLRLDFPVVLQMADLRSSQLERVTPLEFMIGQVQLGPAFLLAFAGLLALIFSRDLRQFRLVGWTCAFAFLILLTLKGKAYYLGPIYPCLFAAGGFAIERIASDRARRLVAIAGALLIIAYGVALLPIGLPILPPDRMFAYTEAIGATEANRTNRGELDRLPQDYADMLGWKEQVAAVAEVYNSLSPHDRERAVIIAGNYGEAGAIDYYGPGLGLPNAISVAGTYWFFGPGNKPGEVAVTVGIPKEDLTPFFREVSEIRRSTHPWAVAEERDIPIHVARKPYRTLQEVWPSLAGEN